MVAFLESIEEWFTSVRVKERDFDFRSDIYGATIFCVGQPGSGKTYRAAQLALRAGYDSGLPVVMHGLNGDMEKFYHAALNTAKKNKSKNRKKIEFLLDDRSVHIINEEGTGELESYLSYLSRKALRGNIQSSEMILCIDEAGALRLNDESFWNVSRRFRNYGVLCYATGHRMVDLIPSARETLRAVVPFVSYEYEVELFGKKFHSTDFTKPGDRYVKYMSNYKRELEEWDSELNPPDILIEPARPTRVKEMYF